MSIFRWDLDKTYLHTDIGSFRGLIRAAFETADQKQTVPGAAPLIRALIQHDPNAQLSFLSGSPTQMREVLLEKLALDGVRPHKLILKNNLRNIRRGHLRAVRGQVGYKLSRLLAEHAEHYHGDEYLFGDDSEHDALIYALYASALRQDAPPSLVHSLMQKTGAYSDTIQVAIEALQSVPKRDPVRRIFIRVVRGVPNATFSTLGPLVLPISSWFQAAIVLWSDQKISTEGVISVMNECRERNTLSTLQLSSLVQDIARRAPLDHLCLEPLFSDARFGALSESVRDQLRLLGPPAPCPPKVPNYSAFIEQI